MSLMSAGRVASMPEGISRALGVVVLGAILALFAGACASSDIVGTTASAPQQATTVASVPGTTTASTAPSAPSTTSPLPTSFDAIDVIGDVVAHF